MFVWARSFLILEIMKSILRTIHTILCATKQWFVLYALIEIMTSFVPAIQLFLFKIITQKLVDFEYNYLLCLMAGYLVLTVASSGVLSFQEWLKKYMKYRMELYCEPRILDKVYSHTIDYLDAADNLYQIDRAILAIKSKMMLVITEIFSAVGILFSLIFTSYLIGKTSAIYLAFSYFIGLTVNFFAGKNVKEKQEMIKEQEPYNKKVEFYYSIQSNYTALREVKSLKIENWVEKQRTCAFKKYRALAEQFSVRWMKINLGSSFVLYIFEGGSLAIVLLSALKGFLSVDQVVFLMQSPTVVIENISQLIASVLNIFENKIYLDAYNNLTTKDNENCFSGIKTVQEIRSNGEIVFESVSFSYRNQTVLNNINLRIPLNRHIAIIGKNGSGKSTLIKLIAGLLRPTQGNLKIPELKVAASFQDYARFKLSIYENLFFNRQDVPKVISNKTSLFMKQLNFFCTFDQIKEIVLGPDLYENGQDLSSGEWEKIEIIRALIYESDLLILDEPSSNLDVLSSTQLQEILRDECSGKTVIYVTHQLQDLKYADYIVCVEDGEVIVTENKYRSRY